MIGQNFLLLEKTAPPTGGHVFQRTGTTFELSQHNIKANILTKFHENWAKNVTSHVFTYKRKMPPPLAAMFIHRSGHEIFELDRDIIETNLLTKFHEDRTINVASRVFTNKCGRTDGWMDDGQRPVTKAHLSNEVS
ncbi:hypothetical protein DPMN_150509 [Dreissena polymorpha]|uniref:Uncharacterized protein n=1 Tax=Dreissena polymorpha TaxID=45954 RepID=A0A9D4FGK8_DREPO|nr:hypothetical protein DPMN_150509 [Dreissena polymorpha]